MSNSGNRGRRGQGGRRLVADRRNSTTPAKPAQTRRRKTTRRKAPARRRGILGFFGRVLRFVLRLIFGFLWRGTLAVLLILGVATAYMYTTLPPLGEVIDGRQRGSVTMLDRDGNVFAWRGEQFGGMGDPTSISPHLVNAVVATEDRRFYRHWGISPRGIASAIRINLSEGRGPLEGHGGSTITQQVAKLMCLGVQYDAAEWESEAEYEADCRRSSLWRKIAEIPFSLAMELRYTKDEILTIYLNRAYLGAGAYGVEAAMQRYFGRSAAEANPQQSAMLAGLLTAPSRFAPTTNLQRSQDRAAVVLGLMAAEGYLTEAEAEAARNDPAVLSDAAEARAGGYFADWIMTQGPDFLTTDTTEDVIVRTTFDPRMQEAAEAALAEVFANQASEGSDAEAAIVVMSADGSVRAMVGGRESGTGLFNRATMAMRQTGSAFKPFVYATALDLGWRFDDMIMDEPLTINVPGSGPYSPVNYDRRFRGEVTLTAALQHSLNIPAVRLSEAVGRDLVRTVASQFGIESDLAAGPALALGASESTLIEMTGAYAGILNGGSAVTPYGLIDLRLLGDSEPMIGQGGGIRERVISEAAARQLTYMMAQVVANGTGRRAALEDRPVAGKTGTTSALRDAWFVGFTADYVAGVWIGYDDNRSLSGITGGGLPAEIWRQTMERVHEGLPPRPLPMIDPVAEARPPEEPQGIRLPGNEPGEPDQGLGGFLRQLLGGN